MKFHTSRTVALAAAASLTLAGAFPALAGTSVNSNGINNSTRQGAGVPAITISFSGQTALREFNKSAYISLLQPETGIQLKFANGTITRNYWANNTVTTGVQLANQGFATQDTNYTYSYPNGEYPGTPSVTPPDDQTHSALRLEWHEQGSVQGFYDLLNDQVGYFNTGANSGPISNVSSRGASTANPTWINQTSFTNDLAIANQNGHKLTNGNFANTYDPNVYIRTSGQNIAGATGDGTPANPYIGGGQNRVQFAIGEYKTEGLRTGTITDSAIGKKAGQIGYGQGNPALIGSESNPTNLGVKGQRQAFRRQEAANYDTTKINPESANGGPDTDGAVTGTKYSTGPWNSAGADNIDSKQVAVTAVTFSANPGTGLFRLNKTNAQWLQTTGRLANGADYNVVSRANDAGQRIIPALATGIDPSWAVGENDGGVSTGTLAEINAQKNLGSAIRFSGKTGGGESRATIRNSRLGIGTLSIAESRETNATNPLRTLDIDFDNTGNFVRVNFDNIVGNTGVGPAYKAVLISHYNTLKSVDANAQSQFAAFRDNPSNVAAINSLRTARNAVNPGTFSNDAAGFEKAAWALVSSDTVGIKGDPDSNVKAFIKNVTNSIGTGNTNVATIANPADGLFLAGYLTPGLLNWKRTATSDTPTDNPDLISPSEGTQNATYNLQQTVKTAYQGKFTAEAAGSSVVTPGTISSTKGTGNYGSGNTSGAAINGNIPITALNSSGTPLANAIGEDGNSLLDVNGVVQFAQAPTKGNYLFGNFNQVGSRDYASVKEGINAALALAKKELTAGTPGKSSIYTADNGFVNSTVITPISGSPAWTTTAGTKGDLITLGDFNSDGKFDGRDVYLLARGASLSDDPASIIATPDAEKLTNATGTNLDERLRNPLAKLNKNGALDDANTKTTPASDANDAARAFLRTTGRAELSTAVNVSAPAGATVISTTVIPLVGTITNYTFDPSGDNAFNKRDVNRDGKANFFDAAIVDGFSGKAFNDLDQQLGAVVATTVNDGGTVFYGTGLTPTDPTLDGTTARRQISLVDAELDDNATINAADVAVANTALTGAGNDEWYAGNNYKVGPNTIAFNRTSSTVTLDTGATLQIVSGTVENKGADIFTSGGNSIDVNTGATGTLKISSGSQTTVSKITGTGTTEVAGTGTKLTAKLGVIQNAISLNTGGKLDVAPNGSSTGVTQVKSLNIDAGSTLELHDNDLAIDYTSNSSPYATVIAHVKTGLPILGFSGANGKGITSTEVQNQTLPGTILAVVDGGTTGGLVNSLSGAPVANPSSSVLIKYTWRGDANLDGAVNGSDYALADTGFSGGGTGWFYGDVNYDGVINGSDYALIDTGFSSQTGPLPEPATLSLLGIGAISLLRRRRQSK